MRPLYCSHVHEDGRPCHGWAGKGGKCPIHQGKRHGIGGRPSNAQLSHIAKSREGWVAACGCATGRDD